MSYEYTAERREYFRLRYIANRDEILSRQREYQAKNPDVVKRAQDKYKKKHSDKLAEKRRIRYHNNIENEKKAHACWRNKNKDYRASYMRDWREEKFAHRKEYDRAYRLAHLEQRAETENRRRARKTGNGGGHTQEEWRLLKAAHDFKCAYCHATSVRLTKDHDIPLSRGGTDDIENIVPACLPCNRRKSAKTGAEFVALMGTVHAR